MKYNIPLFLSILYLFSCSGNTDRQNINQILMLEYTRSKIPHIFDQYISIENEDVRLQVANSIANIQDTVHVGTLKKLLKDHNDKIIKKSIFALGQISGQDAIGLLKDILKNETFVSFRRNIIQALGRTEEKHVANFLVSLLPSLHDSLLDCTIMSIAFLTPRKERNSVTNNAIRKYLYDSDENIRTAAVYFFTRNPDTSVMIDLLRVNFNNLSLGYKYKFKALDQIVTRAMVKSDDTFFFDSLKIDLLHHVGKDTLNWLSKLYQISLLSNSSDSLVLKTISGFLHHKNPHLRHKAISAISKIELQDTKKILLNYYNTAGWQEKGEIIYALAKKEPNLSYRLIQQNLDQGTIYFKQLLLKSLARVKNSSALIQLHQFLNVPNVRLQFTAFDELVNLNRIKYVDVKNILLSGDEALVIIAASWLTQNAKQGVLDDLEKAYSHFIEPDGVNAKLAILEAIEAIKDEQSIGFLKSVIMHTQSASLAHRAAEILTNFDIHISVDSSFIDSLFIPKNIIDQTEPITATINTEKGDIRIELWPDLSPLAVTNFINLAESGFYNNTSFHRVVSDFVIQGGDPRGDGWGGPGYHIPCEYSEIPFMRGSIGVATAGKDTGGSQFFICHSEQPHLTGRYTLFGRVMDGMDVVDKIEIDDKITKISIQHRGAL